MKGDAFQVRIDAAEKAELKRLARSAGLSLSELVLTLLRKWREDRKDAANR